MADIAEKDRQLREMEAELRTARDTSRIAAATAEAACTRLLAYEATVEAARDAVEAFELADQERGHAAFAALMDAVGELPPRAS